MRVGFRVGLVAEKDGHRLAIECDGEIWHQDEHGALKVEDVQRQEILQRAGWRVLPISYRRWRSDPAPQLSRVTRVLLEMPEEDEPSAAGKAMESAAESKGASFSVDTNEAAILRAVRSGEHEREAVLSSAARVRLGKFRLGSQIRRSLEAAIVSLAQRGLVVVEEAEVFATEEGRMAILSVHIPPASSARKRRFRGDRRCRRADSPPRSTATGRILCP